MVVRPQVITQGVVTQSIGYMCDAVAVLSDEEFDKMLDAAEHHLLNHDHFMKDSTLADQALLRKVLAGLHWAKHRASDNH